VDAGEGEPLREVVVRRPLHSSGLYQRIRFLGADGVELTVEALAIAAYRAVGCEAVYTENVVFTTLFGILCWDVLFAEVPDVFQTPFQIAPLDLNTEGFFEARQALFAARLESLRVDPVPVLRAHHAAYFGLAAQGVAWEVYPLAVLEQICLRLGGERLSLLMRALAEDYGKRRRGLPDLLVWVSGEVDSPELFWEQLPYEPPAAVFFAEVKSPRDRLSVEQRAWISTLSTLGLPVEVCRVEVGQTL
jgi:Fanconi-associated nuclease 1